MTQLSERQSRLLEAVIREYIRTVGPVASAHLHGRFGFRESPATIRNTMAELEAGGFLTHPHTSAGRIPTEKGYRYYIEHHLAPASRETEIKRPFEEVSKNVEGFEEVCREITRVLADVTGEAAFLGLGTGTAYYTGLSRLVAKPEFHEYAQLLELGALWDQFDDLLRDLNQEVAEELQILVGKDNPFGRTCSSIVVKLHTPSQADAVLGLLGPMRMNYEHNVDALLQAHHVLERIFDRYE